MNGAMVTFPRKGDWIFISVFFIHQMSQNVRP